MSTPVLKVERLWLRENQLFLVLTIVIGVLAGLSAVLFTLAIEQASTRLFGLDPSALRLFLVPALMSLVSGILLVRFFPDVRGSGVPQTKAAYHLSGGVIPARAPLGKFLMGVLCIGSGHSLGREGPSVQIGAGIASVIGRWMRLSPASVRNLVPVGSAAALSAAFNTPVSAVLFALEEIIGDMNAALLGSTVVASVAAVIVERAILGNEPLFHVPAYHLVHPAELAAYAVLGIAGGILSLVFSKSLLALRGFFLRLPLRTRWLQPAMGGVVIGVVLVYVPAVMGVGYEYVGQALNGGLPLRVLGLLCIVKLGSTVVSYASGNAGGIFAPSLFIGAMAGGAVGVVVHGLAPTATGDPGAYALVGMGTLFAGIIRAPMTSVFMIFEITQDYQILVPLMVANLLSYAISKRFQPAPVYNALLQQDGVSLPSPAAEALQTVHTARRMMRTDVWLVAHDTPVEQVWRQARERVERAYLVGSRERLTGSVTRLQLERWIEDGRGAEPVGALLEGGCVHAHPDHPIQLVLDRFAQAGGVLPVISRVGGRVEGVITRDCILEVVEGEDRSLDTSPS